MEPQVAEAIWKAALVEKCAEFIAKRGTGQVSAPEKDALANAAGVPTGAGWAAARRQRLVATKLTDARNALLRQPPPAANAEAAPAEAGAASAAAAAAEAAPVGIAAKGWLVRVWWPTMKVWHEGTIAAFRPAEGDGEEDPPDRWRAAALPPA